MIDLKTLVKSGVHFGHQTSRWCPKMAPYIWGHKNNIHLIDISKTAHLMEKAAQFLESIAAKNKSILLVGTKKAAKEIVKNIALELNLPYVTERWIGGIFTNRLQVQKAIKNYQNYKEILGKASETSYTKKELSVFQKRFDRLEKSIGGLQKLTWPVGAIVVVDVKKEHVAVKEAQSTGIPIVALVDTNCNPTGIDYPIPANDDAPRAIAVVLNYLAQAIKKGQEGAEAKSEEVQEHQEAENILLAIEEEEESKPEKEKPKAKPIKLTEKETEEEKPKVKARVSKAIPQKKDTKSTIRIKEKEKK
jgi:small subunit ribosomal protein S2